VLHVMLKSATLPPLKAGYEVLFISLLLVLVSVQSVGKTPVLGSASTCCARDGVVVATDDFVVADEDNAVADECEVGEAVGDEVASAVIGSG